MTSSYLASRTRGKREGWQTVSTVVSSEALALLSLIITVSVPDGKVCINAFGELAVTKFAVEPVRS